MTDRDRHGALSIEIEVVPGLEEFAIREIEGRLRPLTRPQRLPKEGRLAFRYGADVQRLNQLRSVVAVHLVQAFDVPRPKALLGHERLQQLLRLARTVMAAFPKQTFTTFRVSAAGADSSVFARLKAAIAADLGLVNTDREGDLLLTFRRPVHRGTGWELLVRTSPRPLAARAWRVCDMPGALNASVAHAMVTLAEPSRDEVFINVCCGSGTLMVERLELGPATSVTGIDIDTRALDCARTNLLASGHAQEARLLLHDARSLPHPSASVRTIVADLPYAMLVGSGEDNRTLYPEILKEAARVAESRSRLVLITTQSRLMAAVLEDLRGYWLCTRTIPIKIPYRSGYLTPSIYVLCRNPSA